MRMLSRECCSCQRCSKADTFGLQCSYTETTSSRWMARPESRSTTVKRPCGRAVSSMAGELLLADATAAESLCSLARGDATKSSAAANSTASPLSSRLARSARQASCTDSAAKTCSRVPTTAPRRSSRGGALAHGMHPAAGPCCCAQKSARSRASCACAARPSVIRRNRRDSSSTARSLHSDVAPVGPSTHRVL